jgi:putative ABC transport system ATP-binding protein
MAIADPRAGHAPGPTGALDAHAGLKPCPTDDAGLKPCPTEDAGLKARPTEDAGLKARPTDTGEALVCARGLTKTYTRAGQPIPVLRALDLDVARGEFVAFMGPSGSGKTTLLNLLGGLDVPTAGTITIGGTELTRLSRRALARWRARHVGFVFQAYNLLPVLSAYRNVELPLLLTRLGRAARRTHVHTALRIVGLLDRMHHFPRQLSGGQEQRVAIARAIVTDPAILLCDEPTGDLDRASADTVLELLTLLAGDHGTTILMVTHDPRAAERAHTVHHLDKGVLMTARPGVAAEVHA